MIIIYFTHIELDKLHVSYLHMKVSDRSVSPTYFTVELLFQFKCLELNDQCLLEIYGLQVC